MLAVQYKSLFKRICQYNWKLKMSKTWDEHEDVIEDLRSQHENVVIGEGVLRNTKEKSTGEGNHVRAKSSLQKRKPLKSYKGERSRNEYLVNLIGSTGPVDFSSEVTAALGFRLSRKCRQRLEGVIGLVMDQAHAYSSHKAVTECMEAKALGIHAVPVLIEHVTDLLLSKPAKGVRKPFFLLSLLGTCFPSPRKLLMNGRKLVLLEFSWMSLFLHWILTLPSWKHLLRSTQI